MRALWLAKHGGPDALTFVDRPEPTPQIGEVLVDVTHVGLNHLDVWVRRGVPGHRFPLPLIPGSDVCGIRRDTGEAVALYPATCCMRCESCLSGRQDLCRQYKIRGEGTHGGLCDTVAVPEWQCLPIGNLEPSHAAALPLSLLTAWHMLSGRAQVQAGDTILIQGGAGGVGSLAIQVANHLGARVMAVGSTAEKRALCTALGAEITVSPQDVKDAVSQWTHKRGVDCVVEHVGAATWEQSLRAVRWGGTVVTCGATTGHEVELDLRVLFFKQLSLLGSTMGTVEELRRAWIAVRSGSIRSVVDRVLPVAELAEGHRLLEEREVRGKVVIEWRS